MPKFCAAVLNAVYFAGSRFLDIVWPPSLRFAMPLERPTACCRSNLRPGVVGYIAVSGFLIYSPKHILREYLWFDYILLCFIRMDKNLFSCIKNRCIFLSTRIIVQNPYFLFSLVCPDILQLGKCRLKHFPYRICVLRWQILPQIRIHPSETLRKG